jgi:hypothetical protein
MKKVMVILLMAAFVASGCAGGILGSGGAKIAVKDQQSKKVELTTAISELEAQYGEPVAHYRGYKDVDGNAHVIKDLYYTAADGRTVVTVTVIDDEVKQIITTVK